MSTQLGRDNLKLLESGLLSDFEVICKERVWKVHKVILCSRSKWFQKALTGNWVECASGKVTVDDMDPDMMDTVLKYLYSGDIRMNVEEEHLSLRSHVQLWIHADFFKLEELKEDVSRRIFATIVCIAPGVQRRTKPHWICGGQGENLKRFNTDLFQAIDLAYAYPGARGLQKRLTACIFAMGTDVSNDHISALDGLPSGFKSDLLVVLMNLRFDAKFSGLQGGAATMQAVESILSSGVPSD